jgi:hypothetical protein
VNHHKFKLIAWGYDHCDKCGNSYWHPIHRYDKEWGYTAPDLHGPVPKEGE